MLNFQNELVKIMPTLMQIITIDKDDKTRKNNVIFYDLQIQLMTLETKWDCVKKVVMPFPAIKPSKVRMLLCQLKRETNE